MKPMQRKIKRPTGDCFNCEHCQYYGEGDSFCDIDYTFVLEDWTPTEKFKFCKGKEWKRN
jgi:hypothetical protein